MIACQVVGEMVVLTLDESVSLSITASIGAGQVEAGYDEPESVVLKAARIQLQTVVRTGGNEARG